ncbi:hypothetical protein GA0115240_17141, partial [Streptomyces sp. DvalAA-14]|uniref:hypothetical protein n=1 Tax=unclassified Streptomyces TaxID=2593676 RepID=UPI00081B407F
MTDSTPAAGAEDSGARTSVHLTDRNGGVLSRDGTTYTSPSGVVEHGITTPDGRFLPNGAVRTVDGHQLYGTPTDGGGFLSEDGTTFVTPKGVVEHGQTSQDGHFLTQRVVDGHPLWGSDTQDDGSGAGWMSQDGTVYIDPAGKVAHGLTAPDGQFLADGVTRVVAGQQVYGTPTDGG